MSDPHPARSAEREDKRSFLQKVDEFIHFLPVLAYDGSSMKQMDAAGVLDMATSGTTATLLARRWESALLVNVDNGTLQRLMDNKAAMDALKRIEGFRNLNRDIETIINKSEAVKKARREANDKEFSAKQERELTEKEREYKALRRQIQEKLIKFATRVPVFMYLTDYRERCLKDVVTKLEPALFKRVTGLEKKDFELLVSLDAFRRPQRFQEFIAACTMDARGRAGMELNAYPQAEYLEAAATTARTISVQPLLAQGLQGEDLGRALYALRLKAITLFLQERRRSADNAVTSMTRKDA